MKKVFFRNFSTLMALDTTQYAINTKYASFDPRVAPKVWKLTPTVGVDTSHIRFLNTKIYSFVSRHLQNYPAPIGLSLSWTFGALSLLALILQIATGLCLSMHYVPGLEVAFDSVEHIVRDVSGGHFLRYAHSNGASFYFICIYSHILRSLYFKSFIENKSPWNIGVIIFLASMAAAFLGYVLPWGQMSFWGATVITNLFSVIPLVGTDVVHFLWGGFGVGGPTLNRFYTLHFIIPLVILALVIFHVLALHENGSTTPNHGHWGDDTVSFLGYFIIKDLYLIGYFLAIFLLFLVYAPNYLNHPDNYNKADPMKTPPHIVPEWYFLPFYAILRAIPNKTLGVIAMAISVIFLIFLPVLGSFSKFNISFSLSDKLVFWLFVLVTCTLGFLGSMPIETPFVQMSWMFCQLYFLFGFAIGGSSWIFGQRLNGTKSELFKRRVLIPLEKSSGRNINQIFVYMWLFHNSVLLMHRVHVKLSRLSNIKKLNFSTRHFSGIVTIWLLSSRGFNKILFASSSLTNKMNLLLSFFGKRWNISRPRGFWSLISGIVIINIFSSKFLNFIFVNLWCWIGYFFFKLSDLYSKKVNSIISLYISPRGAFRIKIFKFKKTSFWFVYWPNNSFCYILKKFYMNNLKKTKRYTIMNIFRLSIVYLQYAILLLIVLFLAIIAIWSSKNDNTFFNFVMFLKQYIAPAAYFRISYLYCIIYDLFEKSIEVFLINGATFSNLLELSIDSLRNIFYSFQFISTSFIFDNFDYVPSTTKRFSVLLESLAFKTLNYSVFFKIQINTLLLELSTQLHSTTNCSIFEKVRYLLLIILPALLFYSFLFAAGASAALSLLPFIALMTFCLYIINALSIKFCFAEDWVQFLIDESFKNTNKFSSGNFFITNSGLAGFERYGHIQLPWSILNNSSGWGSFQVGISQADRIREFERNLKDPIFSNSTVSRLNLSDTEIGSLSTRLYKLRTRLSYFIGIVRDVSRILEESTQGDSYVYSTPSDHSSLKSITALINNHRTSKNISFSNKFLTQRSRGRVFTYSGENEFLLPSKNRIITPDSSNSPHVSEHLKEASINPITHNKKTTPKDDHFSNHIFEKSIQDYRSLEFNAKKTIENYFKKFNQDRMAQFISTTPTSEGVNKEISPHTSLSLGPYVNTDSQTKFKKYLLSHNGEIVPRVETDDEYVYRSHADNRIASLFNYREDLNIKGYRAGSSIFDNASTHYKNSKGLYIGSFRFYRKQEPLTTKSGIRLESESISYLKKNYTTNRGSHGRENLLLPDQCSHKISSNFCNRLIEILDSLGDYGSKSETSPNYPPLIKLETLELVKKIDLKNSNISIPSLKSILYSWYGYSGILATSNHSVLDRLIKFEKLNLIEINENSNYDLKYQPPIPFSALGSKNIFDGQEVLYDLLFPTFISDWPKKDKKWRVRYWRRKRLSSSSFFYANFLKMSPVRRDKFINRSRIRSLYGPSEPGRIDSMDESISDDIEFSLSHEELFEKHIWNKGSNVLFENLKLEDYKLSLVVQVYNAIRLIPSIVVFSLHPSNISTTARLKKYPWTETVWSSTIQYNDSHKWFLARPFNFFLFNRKVRLFSNSKLGYIVDWNSFSAFNPLRFYPMSESNHLTLSISPLFFNGLPKSDPSRLTSYFFSNFSSTVYKNDLSSSEFSEKEISNIGKFKFKKKLVTSYIKNQVLENEPTKYILSFSTPFSAFGFKTQPKPPPNPTSILYFHPNKGVRLRVLVWNYFFYGRSSAKHQFNLLPQLRLNPVEKLFVRYTPTQHRWIIPRPNLIKLFNVRFKKNMLVISKFYGGARSVQKHIFSKKTNKSSDVLINFFSEFSVDKLSRINRFKFKIFNTRKEDITRVFYKTPNRQFISEWRVKVRSQPIESSNLFSSFLIDTYPYCVTLKWWQMNLFHHPNITNTSYFQEIFLPKRLEEPADHKFFELSFYRKTEDFIDSISETSGRSRRRSRSSRYDIRPERGRPKRIYRRKKRKIKKMLKKRMWLHKDSFFSNTFRASKIRRKIVQLITKSREIDSTQITRYDWSIDWGGARGGSYSNKNNQLSSITKLGNLIKFPRMLVFLELLLGILPVTGQKYTTNVTIAAIWKDTLENWKRYSTDNLNHLSTSIGRTHYTIRLGSGEYFLVRMDYWSELPKILTRSNKTDIAINALTNSAKSSKQNYYTKTTDRYQADIKLLSIFNQIPLKVINDEKVHWTPANPLNNLAPPPGPLSKWGDSSVLSSKKFLTTKFNSLSVTPNENSRLYKNPWNLLSYFSLPEYDSDGSKKYDNNQYYTDPGVEKEEVISELHKLYFINNHRNHPDVYYSNYIKGETGQTYTKLHNNNTMLFNSQKNYIKSKLPAYRTYGFVVSDTSDPGYGDSIKLIAHCFKVFLLDLYSKICNTLFGSLRIEKFHPDFYFITRFSPHFSDLILYFNLFLSRVSTTTGFEADGDIFYSLNPAHSLAAIDNNLSDPKHLILQRNNLIQSDMSPNDINLVLSRFLSDNVDGIDKAALNSHPPLFSQSFSEMTNNWFYNNIILWLISRQTILPFWSSDPLNPKIYENIVHYFDKSEVAYRQPYDFTFLIDPLALLFFSVAKLYNLFFYCFFFNNYFIFEKLGNTSTIFNCTNLITTDNTPWLLTLVSKLNPPEIPIFCWNFSIAEDKLNLHWNFDFISYILDYESTGRIDIILNRGITHSNFFSNDFEKYFSAVRVAEVVYWKIGSDPRFIYDLASTSESSRYFGSSSFEYFSETVNNFFDVLYRNWVGSCRLFVREKFKNIWRSTTPWFENLRELLASEIDDTEIDIEEMTEDFDPGDIAEDDPDVLSLFDGVPIGDLSTGSPPLLINFLEYATDSFQVLELENIVNYLVGLDSVDSAGLIEREFDINLIIRSLWATDVLFYSPPLGGYSLININALFDFITVILLDQRGLLSNSIYSFLNDSRYSGIKWPTWWIIKVIDLLDATSRAFEYFYIKLFDFLDGVFLYFLFVAEVYHVYLIVFSFFALITLAKLNNSVERTFRAPRSDSFSLSKIILLAHNIFVFRIFYYAFSNLILFLRMTVICLILSATALLLIDAFRLAGISRLYIVDRGDLKYLNGMFFSVERDPFVEKHIPIDEVWDEFKYDSFVDNSYDKYHFTRKRAEVFGGPIWESGAMVNASGFAKNFDWGSEDAPTNEEKHAGHQEHNRFVDESSYIPNFIERTEIEHDYIQDYEAHDNVDRDGIGALSYEDDDVFDDDPGSDEAEEMNPKTIFERQEIIKHEAKPLIFKGNITGLRDYTEDTGLEFDFLGQVIANNKLFNMMARKRGEVQTDPVEDSSILEEQDVGEIEIEIGSDRIFWNQADGDPLTQYNRSSISPNIDWSLPLNHSSTETGEIGRGDTFRRKKLRGMVGNYRKRYNNHKFYAKSNYFSAFMRSVPMYFYKKNKKKPKRKLSDFGNIGGFVEKWSSPTIKHSTRMNKDLIGRLLKSRKISMFSLSPETRKKPKSKKVTNSDGSIEQQITNPVKGRRIDQTALDWFPSTSGDRSLRRNRLTYGYKRDKFKNHKVYKKYKKNNKIANLLYLDLTKKKKPKLTDGGVKKKPIILPEAKQKKKNRLKRKLKKKIKKIIKARDKKILKPWLNLKKKSNKLITKSADNIPRQSMYEPDRKKYQKFRRRYGRNMANRFLDFLKFYKTDSNRPKLAILDKIPSRLVRKNVIKKKFLIAASNSNRSFTERFSYRPNLVNIPTKFSSDLIFPAGRLSDKKYFYMPKSSKLKSYVLESRRASYAKRDENLNFYLLGKRVRKKFNDRQDEKFLNQRDIRSENFLFVKNSTPFGGEVFPNSVSNSDKNKISLNRLQVVPTASDIKLNENSSGGLYTNFKKSGSVADGKLVKFKKKYRGLKLWLRDPSPSSYYVNEDWALRGLVRHLRFRSKDQKKKLMMRDFNLSTKFYNDNDWLTNKSGKNNPYRRSNSSIARPRSRKLLKKINKEKFRKELNYIHTELRTDKSLRSFKKKIKNNQPLTSGNNIDVGMGGLETILLQNFNPERITTRARIDKSGEYSLRKINPSSVKKNFRRALTKSNKKLTDLGNKKYVLLPPVTHYDLNSEYGRLHKKFLKDSVWRKYNDKGASLRNIRKLKLLTTMDSYSRTKEVYGKTTRNSIAEKLDNKKVNRHIRRSSSQTSIKPGMDIDFYPRLGLRNIDTVINNSARDVNLKSDLDLGNPQPPDLIKTFNTFSNSNFFKVVNSKQSKKNSNHEMRLVSKFEKKLVENGYYKNKNTSNLEFKRKDIKWPQRYYNTYPQLKNATEGYDYSKIARPKEIRNIGKNNHKISYTSSLLRQMSKNLYFNNQKLTHIKKYKVIDGQYLDQKFKDSADGWNFPTGNLNTKPSNQSVSSKNTNLATAMSTVNSHNVYSEEKYNGLLKPRRTPQHGSFQIPLLTGRKVKLNRHYPLRVDPKFYTLKREYKLKKNTTTDGGAKSKKYKQLLHDMKNIVLKKKKHNKKYGSKGTNLLKKYTLDYAKYKKKLKKSMLKNKKLFVIDPVTGKKKLKKSMLKSNKLFIIDPVTGKKKLKKSTQKNINLFDDTSPLTNRKVLNKKTNLGLKKTQTTKSKKVTQPGAKVKKIIIPLQIKSRAKHTPKKGSHLRNKNFLIQNGPIQHYLGKNDNNLVGTSVSNAFAKEYKKKQAISSQGSNKKSRSSSNHDSWLLNNSHFGYKINSVKKKKLRKNRRGLGKVNSIVRNRIRKLLLKKKKINLSEYRIVTSAINNKYDALIHLLKKGKKKIKHIETGRVGTDSFKNSQWSVSRPGRNLTNSDYSPTHTIKKPETNLPPFIKFNLQSPTRGKNNDSLKIHTNALPNSPNSTSANGLKSPTWVLLAAADTLKIRNNIESDPRLFLGIEGSIKKKKIRRKVKKKLNNARLLKISKISDYLKRERAYRIRQKKRKKTIRSTFLGLNNKQIKSSQRLGRKPSVKKLSTYRKIKNFNTLDLSKLKKPSSNSANDANDGRIINKYRNFSKIIKYISDSRSNLLGSTPEFTKPKLKKTKPRVRKSNNTTKSRLKKIVRRGSSFPNRIKWKKVKKKQITEAVAQSLMLDGYTSAFFSPTRIWKKFDSASQYRGLTTQTVNALKESTDFLKEKYNSMPPRPLKESINVNVRSTEKGNGIKIRNTTTSVKSLYQKPTTLNNRTGRITKINKVNTVGTTNLLDNNNHHPYIFSRPAKISPPIQKSDFSEVDAPPTPVLAERVGIVGESFPPFDQFYASIPKGGSLRRISENFFLKKSKTSQKKLRLSRREALIGDNIRYPLNKSFYPEIPDNFGQFSTSKIIVAEDPDSSSIIGSESHAIKENSKQTYSNYTWNCKIPDSPKLNSTSPNINLVKKIVDLGSNGFEKWPERNIEQKALFYKISDIERELKKNSVKFEYVREILKNINSNGKYTTAAIRRIEEIKDYKLRRKRLKNVLKINIEPYAIKNYKFSTDGAVKSISGRNINLRGDYFHSLNQKSNFENTRMYKNSNLSDKFEFPDIVYANKNLSYLEELVNLTRALGSKSRKNKITTKFGFLGSISSNKNYIEGGHVISTDGVHPTYEGYNRLGRKKNNLFDVEGSKINILLSGGYPRFLTKNNKNNFKIWKPLKSSYFVNNAITMFNNELSNDYLKIRRAANVLSFREVNDSGDYNLNLNGLIYPIGYGNSSRPTFIKPWGVPISRGGLWYGSKVLTKNSPKRIVGGEIRKTIPKLDLGNRIVNFKSPTVYSKSPIRAENSSGIDLFNTKNSGWKLSGLDVNYPHPLIPLELPPYNKGLKTYNKKPSPPPSTPEQRPANTVSNWMLNRSKHSFKKPIRTEVRLYETDFSLNSPEVEKYYFDKIEEKYYRRLSFSETSPVWRKDYRDSKFLVPDYARRRKVQGDAVGYPFKRAFNLIDHYKQYKVPFASKHITPYDRYYTKNNKRKPKNFVNNSYFRESLSKSKKASSIRLKRLTSGSDSFKNDFYVDRVPGYDGSSVTLIPSVLQQSLTSNNRIFSKIANFAVPNFIFNESKLINRVSKVVKSKPYDVKRIFGSIHSNINSNTLMNTGRGLTGKSTYNRLRDFEVSNEFGEDAPEESEDFEAWINDILGLKSNNPIVGEYRTRSWASPRLGGVWSNRLKRKPTYMFNHFKTNETLFKKSVTWGEGYIPYKSGPVIRRSEFSLRSIPPRERSMSFMFGRKYGAWRDTYEWEAAGSGGHNNAMIKKLRVNMFAERLKIPNMLWQKGMRFYGRKFRKKNSKIIKYARVGNEGLYKNYTNQKALNRRKKFSSKYAFYNSLPNKRHIGLYKRPRLTNYPWRGILNEQNFDPLYDANTRTGNYWATEKFHFDPRNDNGVSHFSNPSEDINSDGDDMWNIPGLSFYVIKEDYDPEIKEKMMKLLNRRYEMRDTYKKKDKFSFAPRLRVQNFLSEHTEADEHWLQPPNGSKFFSWNKIPFNYVNPSRAEYFQPKGLHSIKVDDDDSYGENLQYYSLSDYSSGTRIRSDDMDYPRVPIRKPDTQFLAISDDGIMQDERAESPSTVEYEKFKDRDLNFRDLWWRSIEGGYQTPSSQKEFAYGIIKDRNDNYRDFLLSYDYRLFGKSWLQPQYAEIPTTSQAFSEDVMINSWIAQRDDDVSSSVGMSNNYDNSFFGDFIDLFPHMPYSHYDGSLLFWATQLRDIVQYAAVFIWFYLTGFIGVVIEVYSQTPIVSYNIIFVRLHLFSDLLFILSYNLWNLNSTPTMLSWLVHVFNSLVITILNFFDDVVLLLVKPSSIIKNNDRSINDYGPAYDLILSTVKLCKSFFSIISVPKIDFLLIYMYILIFLLITLL